MLRPWFTLLTPENHLNLLFIFPSVLTLVWFSKGAGCEQGITSDALQCEPLLSCFSAQHSPSTIEHMLVSLDLCVPVCPIILQLHRVTEREWSKNIQQPDQLLFDCVRQSAVTADTNSFYDPQSSSKRKAHLFPTKSYVFFFMQDKPQLTMGHICIHLVEERVHPSVKGWVAIRGLYLFQH